MSDRTQLKRTRAAGRLWAGVLGVALLAGGCGADGSPPPEDAGPGRVAIIAPLDIELEPLLARAEIGERRVIAGQTHHLGRLAGQEVVLLRSGRSMVNGALAAQAAIDHHDLRGVVVVGIAGGIGRRLRVCDVAVPARWGQYQEHVLARETEDGWDVGRRRRGSDFANLDMYFPRPQRLELVRGEEEISEMRFWFDADPGMLEAARRGVEGLALEGCAAAGETIAAAAGVVVGGNGVSGPGFVDNARYRDWIRETFDADVVDMETAAVAHVAYVNGLPFIAFRSVSDLAGGAAGENRVRETGPLAAGNSAAAVLAFLEKWKVG